MAVSNLWSLNVIPTHYLVCHPIKMQPRIHTMTWCYGLNKRLSILIVSTSEINLEDMVHPVKALENESPPLPLPPPPHTHTHTHTPPMKRQTNKSMSSVVFILNYYIVNVMGKYLNTRVFSSLCWLAEGSDQQLIDQWDALYSLIDWLG